MAPDPAPCSIVYRPAKSGPGPADPQPHGPCPEHVRQRGAAVAGDGVKRCRPDFLVLGTRQSGSQALFNHVLAHPKVWDHRGSGGAGSVTDERGLKLGPGPGDPKLEQLYAEAPAGLLPGGHLPLSFALFFFALIGPNSSVTVLILRKRGLANHKTGLLTGGHHQQWFMWMNWSMVSDRCPAEYRPKALVLLRDPVERCHWVMHELIAHTHARRGNRSDGDNWQYNATLMMRRDMDKAAYQFTRIGKNW